jgi:hypothetical protein
MDQLTLSDQSAELPPRLTQDILVPKSVRLPPAGGPLGPAA